MAEPDPRRRTFGPVVLAGLAAAGLAAIAGHEPWAHGTGSGGIGELSATVEAGRVPAAEALALVVLACWGVLLVTRGLVRRVVAGLGVLASLGFLATVVTGWSSAPDAVRDAYRDLGVTTPEIDHSAWFWVSAVVALLSLATILLAVRLTPAWPEMGRRYDAPVERPVTRPEDETPLDERESLDLWKAINEGRDPTA